jgi:hypothetical protein
VPGILIPLHGTDGKPAGYQYRPDNPRLRDGKPVKYESRSGKPMVIDVPPACQPNLNFPDVDLWITEGPLKADAAATSRVATARQSAGMPPWSSSSGSHEEWCIARNTMKWKSERTCEETGEGGRGWGCCM